MGRIIAADVLESRRDDWSISDDGAIGTVDPARPFRAPPVLPGDDSTPAISVKARLTRSGLPDAYDFLRPKLGRPVIEPWEMEGYDVPSVPMVSAGSFDNELLGVDRYGGGDAAMLVRFLARSDAGALDGWSGFSGHTCQGLYDSIFDDAGGSPFETAKNAHIAQVLDLFEKQLGAALVKWSDGKISKNDLVTFKQTFINIRRTPTPATVTASGNALFQVVDRFATPAQKTEFRDLWNRLGGYLDFKDKGGFLSDLGSAIGSIGKGVASIAQGIATPVAALVTSPAKLMGDLVQGKNVFQSLKDTVQRDLASAKAIAPYVQAALSVIPGVGTGINMAIAAGSALAQGQPLTSALVAGIKGALPGGPLAAQAFDTAYAIARGQNVGEAALQALVNNAPGGVIGKQAAQAAIAVAKGQNLQQAAIGLAKGIASEKLGTLVPGMPSVVTSAARDLVSGKNVVGIAADRFGALVPGGVPSVVASAARDLVSGKNVLETVTQVAKGQAMPILNRFSPNAIGVMNQAGPRVANIGSALPSILPADVRMVAQSLLTNPTLRSLPVDALARRLGTSTHVVRDGMGAVLQAVQKSGGSSVPSLSYSKAMAARVPTSMSFDGAMSNVVSRAAPKVYSHNASNSQAAAKLRSAGMFYRSLSARGLDAGALPMATIRRGSSGDAVVQWQKILGVAADGQFGPNTETATKAFQVRNRLTADGIVGPQTWAVGLLTVATTSLPPLPPATSSPAPIPGSPIPDVTTTASTPPPAAAPILAQTMPMIRRGSEGPPVRTWQTFLKIPVDGKFGPQTEEATKSFQARSGLVADGIVGPATWSKAMGAVVVPTTFPVSTIPIPTIPTPMGNPPMPPFFPPGNNPPGPPPDPPPGWNIPPIITTTPPFFPQPAPPIGPPQLPPTREPGPIVLVPPPRQTSPVPRTTTTTTSPIPGPMPTIRKGSTGDAVKTWQSLLKLRNVDGIFGQETEAATILFQQKHGLTPDGIVGPQTWAAAALLPPQATAAIGPLLLVLGGGALLMMTLGGKKNPRSHARR